MLPATSKADSYSNKTVLKSVGERHLGLKNEINFDRGKGFIFINPRLYIPENNHQTTSGLLGKLTQKFNGLISRYHEWRAKEWFIGFVEKNFEKNNKTRDLLDGVKNSGRVSSSKFLEILVDKDYKISSVEPEVQSDGSLRSRYLIESKNQVIDKLITDDLKNNGFSEDAIGAFLDFFHFYEQSWNPESFKNVMNFLNQYSDKDSLQSSVLRIPALRNRVEEMQKSATDFEAFQQKSARIKLRKNQGAPVDVASAPKFSRMELCDYLKTSWGYSEFESNQEDNLNEIFKNPLQISFLRYLKTGTNNLDPVFLRHLMTYPKLIKLYPHLYGFPVAGEMDNSGLRRVFDDVINELTAMSNQKKSEEIEIESIDNDLLKISMNKIIFNFRSHKDFLGIFLFPDMAGYIKYLNKNIINQENKDYFVAVSKIDIEKVAQYSNFSEEEKLNFSRLIEKLKKDLLEADSNLES
jgi:hypothetical protein